MFRSSKVCLWHLVLLEYTTASPTLQKTFFLYTGLLWGEGFSFALKHHEWCWFGGSATLAYVNWNHSIMHMGFVSWESWFLFPVVPQEWSREKAAVCRHSQGAASVILLFTSMATGSFQRAELHMLSCERFHALWIQICMDRYVHMLSISSCIHTYMHMLLLCTHLHRVTHTSTYLYISRYSVLSQDWQQPGVDSLDTDRAQLLCNQSRECGHLDIRNMPKPLTNSTGTLHLRLSQKRIMLEFISPKWGKQLQDLTQAIRLLNQVT